MMLSESDLLKSLDDEPGTPSTVDVQRAMTAGRRRVVRRGAGYAGAATATALAVAGASVAGGLVGNASPRAATTGAPHATALPPRRNRNTRSRAPRAGVRRRRPRRPVAHSTGWRCPTRRRWR